MISDSVGFKTRTFEPRNLTLFFLLTFCISWITAALLYLLQLKAPGGFGDPAMVGYVLVALPGALGPSLAAFILTAIKEGKPGVKALWGRLWKSRFSWVWVVVCLFGYDFLRLIANLITRVIDGENYPLVDTGTPIWSVLLIFVQSFLLSGMGEEFGWRGYALPRLQAKWNAVTSSLLLGVIWAAWHIPFFFLPGQPLYQRNFLQWLPVVLLSSFFYTWVFNNTRGSVLAAALLHAAFNSTIVILPSITSLWVYYALLALSVGLIIIFSGFTTFTRKKSLSGT